MSIKASVFLEGVGKGDLCAPFFNESGLLHVILQKTGQILSVNQFGQAQKVYVSTGGSPSGACFDAVTGRLLVTDLALGAVLSLSTDGPASMSQQFDHVVAAHEDKPLKGPSSISTSPSGAVFFSDSGALGETGLHSPTGSLFCITANQILRPISLGNLASPSAVACFGSFVFVAEMMSNRVLRYFQQPEGVYHGSVFIQLSGGVGPSSLAVDAQGSLYIGIYDVRESSSSGGTVLIVSSSGKLVGSITTERPEISGLAIHDNILYITERSAGSISKISL